MHALSIRTQLYIDLYRACSIILPWGLYEEYYNNNYFVYNMYVWGSDWSHSAQVD